MLRYILCFFSFLWIGSSVFAQDTLLTPQAPAFSPEAKPVHSEDINKLSPLQIYEDSLTHMADSMYNCQIPDIKVDINNQLIRLFKSTFKLADCYRFSFTKLKDYVNIMDAPDASFRIYNWEFQRNEGNCRYYCVIQKPDGSIIPMIDCSGQIIRGGEDSVFYGKTNRWYGCLYYKMVMKTVSGQQVYFLLGRNSNSLNSDRKIIEPLTFSSSGETQLGNHFFRTIERGVTKEPMRFIHEYQKGSVVTLNTDDESGEIIFDHCESQIGDPAKRYTYIPDGTYDGFRWDGQRWVMYENIIDIKALENGQAPVDKPIK